MHERLQKALKKEFPHLYKHSDIYVDDGWFLILWNFSRKLTEQFPNVYAMDIKEKFGSLCFRLNEHGPGIARILTEMEYWSDRTCERCGKPGQYRDGGWVKILCDEHEEQRQRIV